MMNFSFGNALTHWTKTQGPVGFVWKYALAYGVVAALIAMAAIFLIGGPLINYVQLITEIEQNGVIDEQEVLTAMAGFFLPMLLFIPIGILFWVIFEGALQRRYMRDEGFSLRLGADEGRLFVVGIIWIAFIMALYFGFAILVGIVVALSAFALQGAPEAVAVISVILFLILGVAILYFVVRFSPAAALTVRDRAIRFSSAWGATRGRVWPMFFAFVIMAILAYILSTVLQLVMFGVIGGTLSASGLDFTDPNANVDDVLAVLLSPVTLGIGGLVYLIMTAFQAVLQFAWAGIPALAAKTDPNWSGGTSSVDATFS
ncbi:MAG: hypothetical protein AAFY10_01780 [Pseudomonadota bacterium]